MSIFGAISINFDIEVAVVEHLQVWMLTYLAEIERQQGLSARTLSPIRAFTTINSRPADKWPEDQLPAIVVVSPGLGGGNDAIRLDGDGSYSVAFAIGVAVIASGNTNENVRRNAGIYIAAARAAMLQHPSLGGAAESTSWADERYDEATIAQSRTVAVASDEFIVRVGDVLNCFGGAAAPPEDPYSAPAERPTVLTHDVEVEPK